MPAFALHLFVMPYLKWWQNLLEALVLANYILLFLLRSSQTVLDSLVSYSGTAIPESWNQSLTHRDNLTLFFSIWYYFPVIVVLSTAAVLGIKSIIT